MKQEPRYEVPVASSTGTTTWMEVNNIMWNLVREGIKRKVDLVNDRLQKKYYIAVKPPVTRKKYHRVPTVKQLMRSM